jgi:hypothetical protein
MMSRLGPTLALTVCTLALILTGTSHAGAQDSYDKLTTLPESAFAFSYNPVVIKQQLRMASQFARKVLAGLQAASLDDAVPIDDLVVRQSRDTYGLLRSARSGMGLYKGTQKFPDPTFELAYKRVTQAWDLARIPVDRRCCLPRQAYLAEAIPALTEAIRLVDQALVIMP